MCSIRVIATIGLSVQVQGDPWWCFHSVYMVAFYWSTYVYRLVSLKLENREIRFLVTMPHFLGEQHDRRKLGAHHPLNKRRYSRMTYKKGRQYTLFPYFRLSCAASCRLEIPEEVPAWSVVKLMRRLCVKSHVPCQYFGNYFYYSINSPIDFH